MVPWERTLAVTFYKAKQTDDDFLQSFKIQVPGRDLCIRMVAVPLPAKVITTEGTMHMMNAAKSSTPCYPQVFDSSAGLRAISSAP